MHLLTDAAAMHAVRCVEGGWGMAAHNYDGDVLTDAIAQVIIYIYIYIYILQRNYDGDVLTDAIDCIYYMC